MHEDARRVFFIRSFKNQILHKFLNTMLAVPSKVNTHAEIHSGFNFVYDFYTNKLWAHPTFNDPKFVLFIIEMGNLPKDYLMLPDDSRFFSVFIYYDFIAGTKMFFFLFLINQIVFENGFHF